MRKRVKESDRYRGEIQKREIHGERESVQGEREFFESETRESRCGICKRENHRRGNSRRGVRVARMPQREVRDLRSSQDVKRTRTRV